MFLEVSLVRGALSQSLTPSIIEAKENLHNFLNQIFTMLFFALLSFVVFVELFLNYLF